VKLTHRQAMAIAHNAATESRERLQEAVDYFAKLSTLLYHYGWRKGAERYTVIMNTIYSVLLKETQA
jgi:1,2-phenylacetyl-CoA epoxidase PaaB subunit